MDKFIRNIDHESVVRLAELVSVQSGQVVSKTLAQNKAVSITLFAFDKGEEIGMHDSTGDAMVTVLEAPDALRSAVCRISSRLAKRWSCPQRCRTRLRRRGIQVGADRCVS